MVKKLLKLKFRFFIFALLFLGAFSVYANSVAAVNTSFSILNTKAVVKAVNNTANIYGENITFSGNVSFVNYLWADTPTAQSGFKKVFQNLEVVLLKETLSVNGNTGNFKVASALVINCPGNITSCSSIVSYSIPTTDIVSNSMVQIDASGLTSGGTFPIGTTTVQTWEERDALDVPTGNTCSFTVTVQSVPTAGTISADQTICNGGDPVAFTSIDGTGSGTITYRWESNTNLSTPSWGNIGIATATYDVPSGLTATTQYRRITISTQNTVACESVPTAIVQVTVQSVPTAGTISGDQTICSGGDPDAFTSIDGTGSGIITYRWESNTNLSTPSWGPIGITAATYDVPSGLTTTTQYRRITISTENSVVCESVPTPTIQVIVNPNLPVSVSVSASNTTICSGTNVTFTASPINGGSSPLYQWQVNGLNVGSNSSINTFSSSTLQNGWVVTVVLTSNLTPCAIGSPSTSSPITVTVNPTPSVTTANTATICSGTGPNISLTASTPSSFAWTIGTITGGITGASNGSGSTINQTLTNPSNSAAGTVQYIVTPTATSGSCAGTPYTITVTVNPTPSVTTANTATICSGTGPNISLTVFYTKFICLDYRYYYRRYYRCK